jgi:hypothetical protein
MAMSRLPSVTPTRTPAPNELEYLDVFDFFNVPRLPFGGENFVGAQTQALGPDTGMDTQGGGQAQMAPNEFNITNFMMDANSDWLFKQDGGKFMAT